MNSTRTVVRPLAGGYFYRYSFLGLTVAVEIQDSPFIAVQPFGIWQRRGGQPVGMAKEFIFLLTRDGYIISR